MLKSVSTFVPLSDTLYKTKYVLIALGQEDGNGRVRMRGEGYEEGNEEGGGKEVRTKCDFSREGAMSFAS